MFMIAFRGLGNSIESKTLPRPCDQLFVSRQCDLFGKREVQGYFRIGRDQTGHLETYFTFIPLRRLFVLLFLEEFHFLFTTSFVSYL